MNNINKITAKIRIKKSKTDKNNDQYLILELEDGESVFVFPKKVSEKRWDWLEEGKEYNFTLEEGKNENSFVLVDFEIEVEV